MDAVFLELQIQVCVGKPAGTPMLLGHNLTRSRGEFGADLATPSAVFERLTRPTPLLDGRNVLPSLVVAWAVSVMHYIEDAKLRPSRSIQDFQHMGNTMIRLCNIFNAVPYFASLGNEIVVRVDDEKCGDLFVTLQICHVLSSYASTQIESQTCCMRASADAQASFADA